VLRAVKPQEGKPLIFEVEMYDGSCVLVSSTRLRREAPLLLVDFYETRLNYSP
jgi:hypothetical protein